MSSPAPGYSRSERLFTALVVVVGVVFFASSLARYLGVEWLGPVADGSAGGLWVLVGYWLVGLRASPRDWWAVVGAFGFLVGGLSEVALVWLESDPLQVANGVGVLVGMAAFVYEIVRTRREA